MRETTDAQLVAGAVSGDNPAFDELVSRYRTRVYHLALSKVRGRDNALDIAQEAFVQAYLSLGSLREPERFSAWLSGIVSNVCKMHFRRMGEVPVAPEMLGQLEASPEPDPNAALAREALDRLPNGTRSAAILYFIEEMKQSEISDFLGISLAAVKSRIRDARTSLRKEMIHMVKQTGRKEEPGDEFARSLKHRLELARWYQEFSDMVDAGKNLGFILKMLKDRDYSQPIKDATSRLSQDIWLPNVTFAGLLADHPDILMPEVLSFVRAGEQGGMIDWAMHSLLDLLELRSVQESVEIAIVCRTMGGLLLGRNPLDSVLQHACEIAQSRLVRVLAQEMHDAVQKQTGLGSLAERYGELLPKPLQIALAVGDEPQLLGYALNWAADVIGEEAASRLSTRRERRPPYAASWMNEDDYQAVGQQFAARIAELSSHGPEAIRSAAAGYLQRSPYG